MNLHSNMYIYIDVINNIYNLDTLSKLHVSPIQIMMFLHFYMFTYGTAKTKRGSKFAVVLDSAMAPKQQQSFFALKVRGHEKPTSFVAIFRSFPGGIYIYIYIYITYIHLESMISCIRYTQDSSYGIILFWYAQSRCLRICVRRISYYSTCILDRFHMFK